VTSEVKVGLLFFIGLGLIVWFTFFVTGLGRKKAEFIVPFRRTDQLKEGDAVTYNGTPVGTVSAVEPDVSDTNEPYVKVGFTVESKFRDKVLVDEKTNYAIQLGVLGGASLKISSNGGQPISSESVGKRTGDSPVSISQIVENANQLIEDNRDNLKDTIATLKESVLKFNKVMDDVRKLIEDNRSGISSAVDNAAGAFGEMKSLLADNRSVLDNMLGNIERAAGQIDSMLAENRKDIKDTIINLPSMVDSVRVAFQNIEKITAENREDFRVLMQRLAELAPKLEKTGDNIEIITTQIAEGKGTLGKLVFSDELHDSALTATTNLNQRLEEVKPFTSGISEIKLYAGVAGGTNVETGTSTGSAYLRIEPRPYKFYQGGVSYRTAPDDRNTEDEDADDLGLNFDLTLGWRFMPDDRSQVYRLTVSGGIIESKIGAKVDVPIWGDQLIWSTMVRQKDNDREVLDRRYEEGSALVRSTIEWQPFRRYRISVIGGVDDIADDPGAWVGIRAELLDNDLRNLTTLSGLSR
jgi:ABC-type transporter Mla subunit MlaD